jgi:aminoglycoside N3'-acetyltransferase
MSITQEEIKTKLHSFGFGFGDRIMVHSSLNSFGHVKGGAEAVNNLDAILQSQRTVLARWRRYL